MPPKHAMMMDDDDDVNDMDIAQALSGMGMNMAKYLNPNYSAEFMEKLPEKVRQRAEVLGVYHEDYMKLQRELEEKETALRMKYDELYAPFFKRRQEIISGTGNGATEEEIKAGFPADHEGKVSLEGTDGADAKGIPDFWLRVLQHNVVVGSMIEEHDEDALRALVNITSYVVDEGQYGSFKVIFEFAPNDYFEEQQLVLTLRVGENATEIDRSPLTWKAGKDLTKEVIQKTQRSKRSGQTRTISREESRPSFFSIFFEKDEDDEEEEEEEEDDEEEQLALLLQLLHNSIVPGAVNYYTGEAPDGSSDVDEEDDEDYDDDEEDDDDEDDMMMMARGRGGRGGRGGGRGGRGF